LRELKNDPLFPKSPEVLIFRSDTNQNVSVQDIKAILPDAAFNVTDSKGFNNFTSGEKQYNLVIDTNFLENATQNKSIDQKIDFFVLLMTSLKNQGQFIMNQKDFTSLIPRENHDQIHSEIKNYNLSFRVTLNYQEQPQPDSLMVITRYKPRRVF